MASENGSESRKSVRGLGSLEALLMEALWASPTHLSVQEVCDKLGPDHNYKTVMTVLNRLVDKELLERELDGRAYKYRPRQTRDVFLGSVAEELVQGYLGAYGQEAARHLSSAITGVGNPSSMSNGHQPATNGHVTSSNGHHTNGNGHHADPLLSTKPLTARHTHAYLEVPARLSPLFALVGVAIVLQVLILLRGRR
jgi:predicted transcriptional regulator